MHKGWTSSVAKQLFCLIGSTMRFKSMSPKPVAPLGSRILTNPDDIFKHNMWDHLEWTEEDEENAIQKALENSSVRIPAAEQAKFDVDASKYWDKFYEVHQTKFFKDRTWLFSEFPELLPPSHREEQVANMCHQLETNEVQSGDSRGMVTELGQHRSPTKPSRKPESFHFHQARQDQKEVDESLHIFPGHQASFKILEIGCGVGNSVFPILRHIRDTNSFLYCCDFSSAAIQLVQMFNFLIIVACMPNLWKHFDVNLLFGGMDCLNLRDVISISYLDRCEHREYDASLCHAFVHDICEEEGSFPFPLQSLDVILAVFVLSSIHPERLQGIVNRLSTYLKPGGLFLFRDYGRYDQSQLRIKKGRCLSENFYIRGDGTCVYYFTKEEIGDLFSKAGMEEVQRLEDRRLQVNRGKKVAMRRVWMQSKYRKPFLHSPSEHLSKPIGNNAGLLLDIL